MPRGEVPIIYQMHQVRKGMNRVASVTKRPASAVALLWPDILANWVVTTAAEEQIYRTEIIGRMAPMQPGLPRHDTNALIIFGLPWTGAVAARTTKGRGNLKYGLCWVSWTLGRRTHGEKVVLLLEPCDQVAMRACGV